MATAALQNNLNELDAMLSDLSQTTSKVAGQGGGAKSVDSSAGYGDYSDYLDGPGTSVASSTLPPMGGGAPSRPPQPRLVALFKSRNIDLAFLCRPLNY